ncbi:DUF2135 domain-containing protein [Massilia sp. W12]|uniref:YfaP family protein n=1 Tax=Massilia sp. W12 TaxID=3126507 RepID=UPI0030D0EE10
MKTLACLCLLYSSAVLAQSGVALDNPAGGWRYEEAQADRQGSGYAYPYSPIDRGRQDGRTLIQGRLQELGRQGRTPLIVINGNPMPLYTDKDGRFVRPYAFGAGSNSIEIRSKQQTYRMQFYEAKANRQQAAIRIILDWDEPQAEIDLHVITPDGQHAFWARPQLEGGGGMDLDSVDGAGPEMFSTTAPKRGLYQVYLNYWGNLGNAGYHFNDINRKAPIITANVTLVLHENTGREKRMHYVAPIRKIGDLQKITAFIW